MSNLLYPNFYRVYGVRNESQIIKPPLPKLERLELPRNSIYHYLGTGPLDLGPTEAENAFRKNTKTIQFASITDIPEPSLGNPRRAPIDAMRLERNYRTKNPRFRPMRNLATATQDPQALVVYNYSYIQAVYKYMRNYYTAYYTASNLLSAMWHNLAVVTKISDRQNFIEFDLPKIIPSVSALNSAENGINQKTAQIFSNTSMVALLELWKWLGERRHESVLGEFDDNQLSKVNIIFRESGRWMMISLGTLNGWRKSSRQEFKQAKGVSEGDPQAKAPANELNTRGNDPVSMQKRFLRTIVSLFEARTAVPEENLGTEDDPKQVTKAKKDGTGVSTQPSTKADQLPVADMPPNVDLVEDEDKDKPDIDPLSDEDDFPAERPEAHLASDGDNLDTVDVGDQLATNVLTDPEFEKQINDDLEGLEMITANSTEVVAPVMGISAPAPVVTEPRDLTGAIIDIVNTLADNGGLSAAEYRRYMDSAGDYAKLLAPDGSPLGKFIEIPSEQLHLKESPSVPDKRTLVDKTMLKSSMLEFDSRYVKEIMQRDIAGMVTNLQRAGVLIQQYNVEEVNEVTGAHYAYEVKVKPLQGAGSTLRFKIPKVEADGTYRVNGVRYRSRKQRGDLPIRKVAPDRVALTSYYGKMFAQRDPKKVNDYGRWLRDSIMAMGLDNGQDLITNMVPGSAFDNKFKAPRLYSAIAQGFRSFTVKTLFQGAPSFWNLSFEASSRQNLAPGKDLKSLEVDGNVLIGSNDKGDLLMMGPNGAIYKLPAGTSKLLDMPAFEDMLGIRSFKSPIDFAELRVFGKPIPLGVILGYLIGLENLVKRLGVTPRIVPAGQRLQLASDEWSIVFLDEAWVFSREDALATMILAGWRDYDTTRTYTSHEFDRKDVYFNTLDDQGLGVRYLRELDLLNQMFIDPITMGLLQDMKEPTVFTELLIRAGEMLVLDQHRDELDSSEMRIKGYERFAGIVYTELVRSLRIHNARSNKNIHPLEINPYAVWISIADDPAKNQVSEINPVQDLKEAEAVTYSGHGGRSSRSLTRRTRAYPRSDMGTISESTVDSSSVAINAFLSADPQFNSLRGTSREYKIGQTGATALFSTSALLSPAADRDDPKRVNFIAIQHGHGIACEGYHQAPLRTGYEQIIGERTSDLFCVTAKKPGKVVSVTADGIIVEYNNGEKFGVEIGRRYGAAAGLTIPHEIVTKLNAGDSFVEGDAIAYNSGFFEPDILNPKQVIWKSSLLVKTVLLESTDTLEDSSAISEEVSRKLRTQITKVRTIVVKFDQAIHRLVQVGSQVEHEAILCIIEDAVSASNDYLDSESLDTLRVLSSQSPQAKARGVVERIEVFYHGEREDMNDSLAALVDASDKLMAKRNRSVGRKAFTGSVDENFRIENEPLALDTAAIRIYITSDVDSGVGDKGVFGNQMKTVHGRVFKKVETRSGTKIDAIFGAVSVDNRIVSSPFIIGTTNTLLKVIGRKVVEAYKS